MTLSQADIDSLLGPQPADSVESLLDAPITGEDISLAMQDPAFTPTQADYLKYEEYAKNKKAFACEKFGALDDEMKAYRGAGLDAAGQRSTQNLTYRALRRISVNIPDMVDELEDECNYLKESLP